MSLTIRDDVSQKLKELQRRLADQRPALEAGIKVVQEVDRRARCDAVIWQMPLPLEANPAATLLAKHRSRLIEWMRMVRRPGAPQQQLTLPGQITELSAHRVTIVIAKESSAAVTAVKPRIIRAMQSKLDDLVRGCR